MENKQSPSKKKLLSIQDEKLIREVNYDSLVGGSARLPKKELILDLEIQYNKSTERPHSQRVLVSIKPKAPAIKTLYIAEKSRFNSKKGSIKFASRLAIGDHSSFTTHFSDNDSNVNSVGCGFEQTSIKSETETERTSCVTFQVVSSGLVSKCSRTENNRRTINAFNTLQRSPEKCYIYTQPPLSMHLPKADATSNKTNLTNAPKVDIATLIITNTTSEASSPLSRTTITAINKKISQLERKLLKQEMVIRSINAHLPLSPSDEECKDKMKTSSGTARAGCSYIQQYSHIPETSAFQRYTQQAAPLSASKATTLDKEHNSEQYGRDFTAYDGITARGRRQCASVPCKRDDIPKLAAERAHKIRHKLNPVRDYRLMDTVHYLAQGEFAPRDDGIKLTPSREAVLSDIIWEDVCRTHWPNTRLGRRAGHTHAERYNTRCELQRLIDSLLRERVAHVERRRRRHYRIVKLNHRHESCRPLGKTGDIIVASHKHRQGDDGVISDAASAMVAKRKWEETGSHRSPRSHDLLGLSKRQHHGHKQELGPNYDDCVPGPSYANRAPPREPTCCYQASSPTRLITTNTNTNNTSCKIDNLLSASSSICRARAPRLVVKKETSYQKHSKDETSLEHYILLPTLVVRTPSNVKRQKKFNELYHRILKVQLKNDQNCNMVEDVPAKFQPRLTKKDVGMNINITLSNTSEQTN